MVWIERNIALSSTLQKPQTPITILTGPSNTGKTSLAQIAFPSHRHVTLALPSEAARAVLDPAAFLASHPPPVVIDDVHRAPRLLHHVARLLDAPGGPPGGIVLVGSRPAALQAAALAAFGDRARLVRVDGLSHAETVAARPDLSIADRLLRGGYPALYADPSADVGEFMRARLADHLVRDLPVQLRVDSVHDFERFLRAAARRNGRLLNKADLAREIGIVGSTAAIWLDTLVEAGVVTLLFPWRPQQGKPLVKAPKLYFLDTGLCAHLLGIGDAAGLAASPQAPALWETYVHAEIRRLAAAVAPAVEPVFWRDRTKEVDFVFPTRRGLVLLDASWSEFPGVTDQRRLLSVRAALGEESVAGSAVVCRTPHRQALREPAGPAVETVGIEDLAGLLG